MRSRDLLVTLLTSFFTAQAACGGSSDTNGSNAGPGGSAGSSAGGSSSGTSGGGSAGSAASNGTSGVSGDAGSSGGGAGGASGASGSGGAAGSAGTGASGGAAGSSTGGNGGTATGGAGGSSSFGGAAGSAGSAGTAQDPVVSVAIFPQNVVIDIANGSIPAPTQFSAIGTTQNGNTVPVDGTWIYDLPQAGTIGFTTGSLAATGQLGGVGTVTFTSAGNQFTATTHATITLQIYSDPQGIDAGIKDLFPGATNADPSMSMLYPYDQTLFPRGIPAPTLQWNGGGANDVYNIKVTSPGLEFDGWSTVPPPSRFAFPTVPQDIWKILTNSNLGPVTVSIQRFDGSQAYLPVVRTWKIAGANLAGTVYYWEVNQGNVVRLNVGDTAPQDFIQKPPGRTCVACHSLSANGQRLAASFDGGWSPWATFDAASGALLYSSETSSGFEAISPDGQYVLSKHWVDNSFNSAGYLSLSTYNSTGELAQLNPGGGAPAHPRWSVDGKKIAFAVRTDGNGLDFNHSTLWMTDVDLTTFAFSNTHQIVPNDGGRPTVTFPSFTPDSKWVVFERSTQARSRGAQSDLWLTNTDGSVVTALSTANGAGLLQGAEASANYEPTVMPIAAGGYFWVVMVSERTYGNTLTDTNPGSRQKQLWVFAVDANPTPGVDPSHPPFWLPGQELTNQNMRGEWALAPCKSEGLTCAAGYDCCSGFCVDTGSGPVCAPPQICSSLNDACTGDSDCCDNKWSCVGGFCTDL